MCKKMVLLICVVFAGCFGGPAWGKSVVWYGFDGTLGADVPDGFLDETNTYWATIIYGDPGSSIVYAEPNPVANTEGTSAEFTPEPGGVGHTFGIPDESGIDFNDFTAYTVELFIYPTVDGDGETRRLWSEYIYAYMYLDGGNTLHAYRKWTDTLPWDTDTTHLTGPDVNLGEWLHVACSWDSAAAGNKFKLYVNGEEEANAPGNSFPTFNAIGAFTIGGYQRDNGSVAQFYYGRIDEFRLSDEALDPSEFLLYGGGGLKAKSPAPQANAEDLCQDVVLGWVPGELADKHDVYLGTDFNDVRDANSTVQLGVYMGRQDPNTYTPDSGIISLGDVYYWRIDEVNSTTLDMWPGPVWVFTTNDGGAFNPDPADEEIRVPLDAELSWDAGCLADRRTLYFSTDFNDVNDRVGGIPLVGVTNWNPPDFNYVTTYYWRVDESNGVTTWPGDVWSFTSASMIVDANLRVWYELDEEEGDDIHDSSGREFHSYESTASGNWDPDGGRWGGALQCDDDIGFDLPRAVLETINKGISVSVWLKDSYRAGEDNTVYDAGFGSGSAEHRVQVFVPNDNGLVEWRAGDDSNDVLQWDLRRLGLNAATLEGWHHWVFVKNELPGEREISIYFDGELADSNGTVDDTLTNIQNAPSSVGAVTWHSADLVAYMDDFRLYDRTLTEGDVVGLFRGGEVELAWAPNPLDGATEVAWDANLTWKPGDYAAQHKVFFGTSWDDVNSAVVPDATKNLGDELYDPGQLDLGQTYYWRIDEVNGPNTWRGRVWSFTAAEFVILDSFEQYNTSTNRVYNTWCDQRCQWFEETGSWLTLAKVPSYPVYSGSQSVEYWYNTNDVYAVYNYAEAWLPLASVGFTDWTSVDVRLLTLFFYGDPINAATTKEQMYVGVKDTDGLYGEMRYGDHSGESLTDLQVAEWQRWDIPFLWFTDSNSAAPNDVNFASMETVHIGFGNRRNPVAGGEGWVYFDDIRLSKPICKPEYGPTGDLDGDCFVGVGDIGAMGGQWLRGDVNLNPVTPPPGSDPNLVGHWELDGDATDSSGNGYDGTPEGSYDWVTGKVGSGAVDLSGGWVVVDDNGLTPKLRMKGKVSVMAWIYLDGWPDGSARVVIKGENDEETFGIEASDENGGAFLFRDANGQGPYSVNCGEGLATGEWIHLAGTYDQNEQLIYCNGVVAGAETQGPIELFTDPNDGLGIGGRYPSSDTSGRFNGKIDDVRVYDRAVTAGEIGYLAAGPTGMIYLQSEANLYVDDPSPEIINFKDFAKLFDYWGDEQLWPPTPAP